MHRKTAVVFFTAGSLVLCVIDRAGSEALADTHRGIRLSRERSADCETMWSPGLQVGACELRPTKSDAQSRFTFPAWWRKEVGREGSSETVVARTRFVWTSVDFTLRPRRYTLTTSASRHCAEPCGQTQAGV